MEHNVNRESALDVLDRLYLNPSNLRSQAAGLRATATIFCAMAEVLEAGGRPISDDA